MTISDKVSVLVSQTDELIQKIRIRAPSEHGQSLVLPHFDEIDEVWNENRARLTHHDFSIDGQSIEALRTQARAHLIETAMSYSRQYRNVALRDSQQIILAGHQPRLFHPGVWFKNFVLSSLGEQLNATAINLIVDNDLCGLSNVAVPRSTGPKTASTVAVPYDDAGGNIPFEMRKINNVATFESFANRLGDAISETVTSPLVHQLWKNVNSFRDNQNRLGHTIAAARHKLEGQFGLETLEVPLSMVCSSDVFSLFSSEILTRIESFQKIYNDSLAEYRKIHRIRSRAHPVPELEQVDAWSETPFWIWSEENPIRRALYVRTRGGTIVLSNRKDIEIDLGQDNLADSLTALTRQGIAIRPRALMTTMYSRLFLSDLFMHGIGGAKYDQLTDAIIVRFWNCIPPSFMTVTATMKLPFQFERATQADVSEATTQLRNLRFHPDSYVDPTPNEVRQLIELKRTWVAKELPKGSRKSRHDAIEECNQKLQPYTNKLAEEFEEQRSAKRSLLTRTRILDARGYSFCCFDESLVAELKSMAHTPS